MIVERSSNTVVGSINLKGPPSNGDVEIGWGLNTDARGRQPAHHLVGNRRERRGTCIPHQTLQPTRPRRKRKASPERRGFEAEASSLLQSRNQRGAYARRGRTMSANCKNFVNSRCQTMRTIPVERFLSGMSRFNCYSKSHGQQEPVAQWCASAEDRIPDQRKAREISTGLQPLWSMFIRRAA